MLGFCYLWLDLLLRLGLTNAEHFPESQLEKLSLLAQEALSAWLNQCSDSVLHLNGSPIILLNRSNVMP